MSNGNSSDPEGGEDITNSPLFKDVSKIAAEVGLPQPMTVNQHVDHWQAMENNQMNLIDAEMGDEDTIKITGEDRTEFVELTRSVHEWGVYKDTAVSYLRKGDTESVEKLLSIFPEHSQLEAELREKLNETKTPEGFEGSDNGIGKIKEVVRGTRYDLKPGKVDFREHVADGVLDEEGLTDALVKKLMELDTVYAEDNMEAADTLINVRKKFGDEIYLRASESLREKFQAAEEAKNQKE